MLRNIFFITMLLALFCLVTGCATVQELGQPNPEFSSAPFEVSPPSVQPLAGKDVPDDIRMATAAIIQKMRQDSNGISGVEFKSGESHYNLDNDFDYQGFSVTDISIIDHWAEESGNDKSNCKLHGVIAFSDMLGRRALVDFIAYYTLSSKKVVIVKSQVMPIAPAFPRTQAFFVKAETLNEIFARDPDFPELYARVVTKAIPMTPSPEERNERRALKKMNFFERLKYTATIKRQDLFMVVFVMDRLTPGADIEVVVSQQMNGMQSLAESAYMDFSGWRAAVFGGNFAIDRDTFYSKVYYKPANGVLPDGKKRVLIGLFSSEKNYNTDNKEANGEADTALEGPLASGRRILEPSDHVDAALIQSRLAELGFYTMKIDGLWGAGSKSALKQFQMNNGLQPDGIWGVGTQIKLFAGTGK